MKWHLPGAVFIAFSQMATAQSPCESTLSQDEINACYEHLASNIDQGLARELSDYSKRLSPNQQEQLLAAQESWEKYREAECAFEASGARGAVNYSEVNA